MSDDDAALAAIARRHAEQQGQTARRPGARAKKGDTFTLSLTIDHEFRRRIRLLAARDQLSIVDFVKAAVAAYEARHGTLKDL